MPNTVADLLHTATIEHDICKHLNTSSDSQLIKHLICLSTYNTCNTSHNASK